MKRVIQVERASHFWRVRGIVVVIFVTHSEGDPLCDFMLFESADLLIDCCPSNVKPGCRSFCGCVMMTSEEIFKSWLLLGMHWIRFEYFPCNIPPCIAKNGVSRSDGVVLNREAAMSLVVFLRNIMKLNGSNVNCLSLMKM